MKIKLSVDQETKEVLINYVRSNFSSFADTTLVCGNGRVRVNRLAIAILLPAFDLELPQGEVVLLLPGHHLEELGQAGIKVDAGVNLRLKQKQTKKRLRKKKLRQNQRIKLEEDIENAIQSESAIDNECIEPEEYAFDYESEDSESVESSNFKSEDLKPLFEDSQIIPDEVVAPPLEGTLAEFVPGKRRGGRYLVDPEGYLYSQHYSRKEDKGTFRSYWKCIKGRKGINNFKCAAGAFTRKQQEDGPDIYRGRGAQSTLHTHPPDLAQKKMLVALAAVRNSALDDPAKRPQQLMMELSDSLEAQGEARPVKLESLKRLIQRDRAELGMGHIPYSPHKQ